MMHDMLKREDIEISVIMATYNPSWEKCVFTLDSILGQKGICFELIVADDGSKDNLFERFNSYLKEKGFSDYKLIPHEKNQGTVRNFHDGVKNASGKYVKLISPGDALFNENSLAEWIQQLSMSGKKWSFSDASYYSDADGIVTMIKCPVAPRVIDCYENSKTDMCRWNYVVLEDYPLGAAILCERELFCIYLNEIVDKVIYAEDLSYVLMMFDDVAPFYFAKPCIIYEFGIGVSTTTDEKWRKRFHNDLKAIESLILIRNMDEEIKMKMSKALVLMNSGSDLKKKIIKNTRKGGLKKTVKYRFNPRMSSEDSSLCGPWWEKYKQVTTDNGI